MSDLVGIVTADYQAAWDYARDAGLVEFVVCVRPEHVPEVLGGAAFLSEVDPEITMRVVAALSGPRSDD